MRSEKIGEESKQRVSGDVKGTQGEIQLFPRLLVGFSDNRTDHLKPFTVLGTWVLIVFISFSNFVCVCVCVWSLSLSLCLFSMP